LSSTISRAFYKAECLPGLPQNFRFGDRWARTPIDVARTNLDVPIDARPCGGSPDGDNWRGYSTRRIESAPIRGRP